MKRTDTEEKRQNLSPLNVWALAFGCVIGWGAFVMPGTIFLPAAGPLGTGIAMALSTAVMLVIGYNYHFMIQREHGAGGAYAFAKTVFGRDQAFLCAWFLSLSYIALIPQNASALTVITRCFLRDALQFGFHYRVAGYDIYFGEILLSEAVLFLLALPFLFREKVVRHLQTLSALLILAGVGVVVCVGVVRLDVGSVSPLFGMNGYSPVLGILVILLLAPWAFVGFDTISLVTREFRFPLKKTFRIIACSILMGAMVYTSLAWLAASSVPQGYDNWQSYVADAGNLSGVVALPTFQSAQAALGRIGAALLVLAALGAILGGFVGFYWASSRLLSAMAEDGILPKRFRNGSTSILFVMGISMIAPFFGRTVLSWIVDTSSIGAAVGFGYTSAAAWQIARKEGNRAVRITGAFGACISLILSLLLLIPRLLPAGALSSASYLVLALWSIFGFALYWQTLRNQLQADSAKSLLAGIILLIMVILSSMCWVRQSSQENTRKVLDNLNHYNTTELAEHGIVLTETENADAEYYLEKQMQNIDTSFRVSTLVQIVMYLAALLFLLKIYQIIMGQRREMEMEKLQAVERSKAKSALLFNMSHDIRTPMNAILGFTTLALREQDLSPQIAEYLSKINASGHNLLTLLNDVLEMSSVESETLELKPEETDLRTVMDEARDLFQAQMSEKQIDFSVDREQLTHWWVLCDRSRLSRILLNLLSNASKFTPEGGAVQVTLQQTGENETFGRYTLQVRDNGIGMSPEFVEKLFDAFERERTSTLSGLQGAGLGMTITKRIVDLMGGEIRVNTAPGEGTEFTIQLEFPLVQNHAEPESEAVVSESVDSVAEMPDFNGRRLLVVEDIEINREIAVMLLEEEGFTVDEAENGQIAVDMVAAAPPGTYDAILMDLQMPVMDGFEATKTIRNLDDPAKSGIPVLAVTANTSEEDVRNTQAAGMNGHLAKPLEIDKLLDMLAKCLR